MFQLFCPPSVLCSICHTSHNTVQQQKKTRVIVNFSKVTFVAKYEYENYFIVFFSFFYNFSLNMTRQSKVARFNLYNTLNSEYFFCHNLPNLNTDAEYGYGSHFLLCH